MSADDIWKINLRGYIIHTYRGTLTSQPGLLKDMVENKIWIKRDDKELVFFDRHHEYFHTILDYLRDGMVYLPDDFERLTKILEEARFYKIQGLIQAVDHVMRGRGFQ